MQKIPHTRSCFVCGESNPLGLRLRMETDGRLVHVHFAPLPEHIGFRQVVHGGLLATVLDEIMVWACAVQTHRFAFCAEMNVRYLQPVRPGETLHGIAELVENRRNKIYETKSELRHSDGAVVVQATGKYMPIKGEQPADMLADLVPDPSAFQLKQD
jgi:uncharacterized protein (TIGR00369 family)